MEDIIDLTASEGDGVEANPIDLGSEDDEDLRLAIAMSLQDQEQLQTERASEASAPKNESQSSSLAKVDGGLLGLDRKQMELERLARLKRKREHSDRAAERPITPPPLRRIQILPRNRDTDSRSADVRTVPRKAETVHEVSIDSNTTNASFSSGTVLLTSLPSRRSRSHPQTLSSISFADLVAPLSHSAQLRSASLSSFIIDFDWLLPHFNTKTVSFVFCLHSSNAQHRALLQQDFEGVSNVRLVLPPTGAGSGGVSCMHSKVMLLFYGEADQNDHRCRIVIPTANLVDFDYGGRGGIMENMVFIIDLPPKDGTRAGANLIPDLDTETGDTNFKKELQLQLATFGTPEDVIKKLDTFDFSKTRDLGFVHAIGGTHILPSSGAKKQASGKAINDFFGSSGSKKKKRQEETSEPQQVPKKENISRSLISEDTQPSASRTGLFSLASTIRSLNLNLSDTDPSFPPRIDYITSSLGNLNLPFLRQLYIAICGHDPTAQSGQADNESSLSLTDALVKSQTSIYFPSSQTVHKSRGGPDAAGTICFHKKYWDAATFPRECLKECIDERGDGVLMHSKVGQLDDMYTQCFCIDSLSCIFRGNVSITSTSFCLEVQHWFLLLQ